MSAPDTRPPPLSGAVCPWWLCPTFDNPLRRLIHDPERILAGLVQRGQTALDLGCGMGYFSIPLARLVGPEGQVICVDVQEQMLHEVLDQLAFLAEVRACLKPSGRLLVVEPRIHVDGAAFERSVELARSAGLEPIAHPTVALSRAVLFNA